MRTSKSISTISYNTTGYLEYILNDLIDSGVVSWWCYIYHYAEENETKNHIHLYIILNKIQDTDILRKNFEEIDINNVKPLGVMPFQVSKFDDWYLYCKHDIDYLRSKNLIRKYEYLKEQFVSSDFDYLNELVSQINNTYGLTNKVIDAVYSNISFVELIKSGTVKLNLVRQAKFVYDILSAEYSFNKKKDIKEEQRLKSDYIECTIPKEIDDIFNDID